MTEQTRVNPNLDALEQRVGELLAQYEKLAVDYARLRDDYAQLKIDANRYIQLWLETKPHKPLSDKQLFELSERCDLNHVAGIIDFGRAVEAAHGIGE